MLEQGFGNWTKISVLGSGAFGEVSLWKNQQTEECIAIKKCKFILKNKLTKRQKERWINEVEIMKTLNHDNLIKFKALPKELEVGLSKNNPTSLPLLSMEYCNKGNLRHVLREIKNCCGLKEREIKIVLTDILNAVEYLHEKNITHRDIKPDNIVLQNCPIRGDSPVYKLIDLGYAKELDDSSTVSFVGTLDYLAPEICKQENYNYSVDYWSLGILAYEIVCGVTPFLPGKSLFERFKAVQEKGPEDISVYENPVSGSLKYSKEILKYNQISNALKEQLEAWLKHVLNIDPSARSKPIGNLTVFQYLQEILKKRIINVFCLNKMEFYSYEINDSTLVGTLRNWISRDIKVDQKNFILLFSKCTQPIPNNSFVYENLTDNNNVYVVQKQCFVNMNNSYNFPFFIKKLFHPTEVAKFQRKEMIQLCNQAVFFASQEANLNNCVKKSINLLIRYIQNLSKTVQHKKNCISTNIQDLLLMVENLNVNNVTCDNEEYRDCLSCLQTIITSTKDCYSKTVVLERKLNNLSVMQDKLDNHYGKIESVLKSSNLEVAYMSLISLIEKRDEYRDSRMNFYKEMLKIVNETIKVKDKFLMDKKLVAYIQAAHILLSKLEKMWDWMIEFDLYISNIKNLFSDLHNVYESLLKTIPKNNTNVAVLHTPQVKNGMLKNNKDTSIIINENESLRKQMNMVVNRLFLNNIFKDLDNM